MKSRAVIGGRQLWLETNHWTLLFAGIDHLHAYLETYISFSPIISDNHSVDISVISIIAAKWQPYTRATNHSHHSFAGAQLWVVRTSSRPATESHTPSIAATMLSGNGPFLIDWTF